MSHIAWTEIAGSHNVRKSVANYPELLGGKSEVTYRAKVKLHGTNGGVKVTPDDRVMVMSRSSIITPTSDNAGFAKWVEANEDIFKAISADFGRTDDVVVYGEWAGPGIQKGVALNQLKDRIFAVFAIRHMDGEGDVLVMEPDSIREALTNRFTVEQLAARGLHIIPWFDGGKEYVVDWELPSAELQDVVDSINADVAAVEACDPFVKAAFGVEGTGEGLVFYPIGSPHRGYKKFSDLGFKAKGEAHKMVKEAKPAQVDPTVAANSLAFAQMVLTEARLEQGAGAAQTSTPYDMRDVGNFLKWIGGDVQKECGDELEASGLDWKAVAKPVADVARAWFLKKAKSV